MNIWGSMMKADKNIEKALDLAPQHSYVISNAAGYWANTGKIKKSIALYLKSLELDPLNYSSNFNLSMTYYMDGQFGKAEENTRKYLLHNPNSGIAYAVLSLMLLQQGKNKEALTEAEKETVPFFKFYAKSEAFYALGEKEKSDELLDQLIKEHSEDGSSNIAEVYAFRNEKNKAFEWLEKSYRLKNTDLFETLNFPSMKNLWGDPRWNAFIKKLPLPEDNGFHLD